MEIRVRIRKRAVGRIAAAGVASLLLVGAVLAVAAEVGALPVASTKPGSPTAFSFRGTLAQPNGFYDLKFTLFGTLTGGTAVAGPRTVTGVEVTGSAYTTTIDFGSDAFDGSARFLEIAWRQSGGTTFTKLTPRVELVAVPYALGLRLPATESTAASGNALSVTNGGGGNALAGISTAAGNGVSGSNLSTGVGTQGTSGSGYGVEGVSERGLAGVYGTSTDAGSGVFGQVDNAAGSGVLGENTGAGPGVQGSSSGGPAGIFVGSGSNPALALENGGISVIGAGDDTSTPAFIHTASATNTCDGGYATAIDNPFTDNNPNALLFASPRNAFPVDVQYNWSGCPTGEWVLVFADSSDQMLDGEAWNILVVDP